MKLVNYIIIIYINLIFKKNRKMAEEGEKRKQKPLTFAGMLFASDINNHM